MQLACHWAWCLLCMVLDGGGVEVINPIEKIESADKCKIELYTKNIDGVENWQWLSVNQCNRLLQLAKLGQAALDVDTPCCGCLDDDCKLIECVCLNFCKLRKELVK